MDTEKKKHQEDEKNITKEHHAHNPLDFLLLLSIVHNVT